MDHDLLMMIYGACIGLVSSFATSLFQSWMGRREYERRQRDEKSKKVSEIYLPTNEEILTINSKKHEENAGDKNTVEYGIILLIVSSFVIVYLMKIPLLELILSMVWSFLISKKLIQGQKE